MHNKERNENKLTKYKTFKSIGSLQIFRKLVLYQVCLLFSKRFKLSRRTLLSVALGAF